jgi:hypothetical protein
MPTDVSQCLRSHSKFDYGIQGVLLSGNITSITAPWSDLLTFNVDLWEIVTIEGKGRGIVALEDPSKGTIIAMYGGVIFDRKNEIPEALGYSLDTKDSGKHSQLTVITGTIYQSLLEPHLPMSQCQCIAKCIYCLDESVSQLFTCAI